MMVNILNAIPDRPVLSFLAEPDFGACSVLREEWFRITRELVASTIAYVDLEPVAMNEVEQYFISEGLL